MCGKEVGLALPRLTVLAVIAGAGIMATACAGGEFQSVSAGGEHTCGLRADGSVECWGRDDAGQSSPPGGIFR